MMLFYSYFIATAFDDPGARHLHVVGDVSNRGRKLHRILPPVENSTVVKGENVTDEEDDPNADYLRGENGTEYACQYAKAQMSEVRNGGKGRREVMEVGHARPTAAAVEVEV